MKFLLIFIKFLFIKKKLIYNLVVLIVLIKIEIIIKVNSGKEWLI